MQELIKFVPLFPLIGFIILGLFGKKIKSENIIGGFASLMVAFLVEFYFVLVHCLYLFL